MIIVIKSPWSVANPEGKITVILSQQHELEPVKKCPKLSSKTHFILNSQKKREGEKTMD